MKIRKGFVSNSSTSSFVCDTELSIPEIKKNLQKMVNFYNDMFRQNNTFEDMFKEPFEGSDSQDDFYIEYFGGNVLRYLANNTTNRKIIIEGAEDNSIPYVLTIIIEEKFNAHRYHLG